VAHPRPIVHHTPPLTLTPTTNTNLSPPNMLLQALRRPLAPSSSSSLSSSTLRSLPLLRHSSTSPSNSPDPTTREVQQSEAKAKADAALTQPRPEGDVVAAGVVSGAPVEMFRRPVRIYQPSQESTQR